MLVGDTMINRSFNKGLHSFSSIPTERTQQTIFFINGLIRSSKVHDWHGYLQVTHLRVSSGFNVKRMTEVVILVTEKKRQKTVIQVVCTLYVGVLVTKNEYFIFKLGVLNNS